MSKNNKNIASHQKAIHSAEREKALLKLHAELYTILAEILRVCGLLNLHPFLQGGSAIGAFFDKGIIPWDDDVDVGLTRDEYKVFVSKGPGLMDGKYYIQSVETDSEMFLSDLLKVRKNDTFFSEEVWNGIPLHHGIFVDIMPYDKVPDNRQLQKVQRFAARKLENIIRHKTLWPYWFKKRISSGSLQDAVNGFKSFLWSRLLPKKLSCALYEKVASAFNNSKIIKCSYYNQVNQIRDHIAVKSVENPVKVTFGPLEAFIPDDVETYLRHHYPNLRPTLPENERESHMPQRLVFSDGTCFTEAIEPQTDVSVIIVNYNTLKVTCECIDSIIEKTSGISYEIILVDNASTDGSKEFFASDKRVNYIYNDENLGFGRANNKGIEAAIGRNILFLNPDTLLKNNAIKILSDYLDEHPEVGACGGNLFLADGTPGMSFGRYLPSLYEELNIFFEGVPNKLLYGKNIKFNHKGSAMEVGFISGADLMVRHSVLDAVGVFNPRFFLYYEETELCLRIHRGGNTVVSVPEAEITHLDGGKTRKTASRESYESFRIQMETSRAIFYDLSYSSFYGAVARFIRNFKCFLKRFSPNLSTRQRWREERYFIEEGIKAMKRQYD